MGKVSRSKIIIGRLIEGDTKEGIVKAVKVVYPDVDDKKVHNQISPTISTLRKKGYVLTNKEGFLKMELENANQTQNQETEKDETVDNTGEETTE